MTMLGACVLLYLLGFLLSIWAFFHTRSDEWYARKFPKVPLWAWLLLMFCGFWLFFAAVCIIEGLVTLIRLALGKDPRR